MERMSLIYSPCQRVFLGSVKAQSPLTVHSYLIQFNLLTDVQIWQHACTFVCFPPNAMQEAVQ